jgi:hypothetical protein
VSPLVDSSGRSTRTPFSNFAPALNSATRWAELTARQRLCRLDEFERHRDPGGPRAGSLGDPLRKVRRGSMRPKAARVRWAMKRITDSFTGGALEEDDYRKQLGDLRAQPALVERKPDEEKILGATRLAQDIPAAWARVSADQRRRIVWSTFEIIRIRGGKIISVRPRSTTAPLLALTSSINAVPTGFEPAISSLTGTYARPLHHGTSTEESAHSRSPLTAL